MRKNFSLRERIELGEELGIKKADAEWLWDFGMRRGSIVSIEDGSGRWYRARVLELREEEVLVKVFEEMAGKVESDLFLILVQAVPNKERMELIIEKAVELGVDIIQPIFSVRSYRIIDLPQGKWHKWQERARRASEQSRRGIVPRVLVPVGLEEGIKRCEGVELKLVCNEREKGVNLREVLERNQGVKSCAIAVGPEGGFSQEEVGFLEREGFISVSLGGRILRTETSAIVGIGILGFYLGGISE